jgi:Flp pilus assembly protein TadG
MENKNRHARQRGQATLLIILSVGLFLLAGIGLMFDVSNMYAQRQLAQNAADAAALAAITSIFNHTNTNNSTFNNTFGNIPNGGGNPARLTCGSTDNHTPCYYARKNGFDPSYSDTVYVDFWNQANAGSQEPGVAFTTNAQNPVPLLRVTILRPVKTTLMRMVSAASETIAAQASAAIVFNNAALPILVLHPTLDGALSLGGTPAITICGGPNKSIQVNSCAGTGSSVAGVSCGTKATSLSTNGTATIDLSRAGPSGNAACTASAGANLGNFGLPTAAPSQITFGTGHYIDPASVLPDPLATVVAPTTTVPQALANQDNTTTCAENAGQSICFDGQTPTSHSVTCPSQDVFGAAVTSCVVLKPGIYTSSGPLGNLKNNYYIFTPGIYYIQSGGFAFNANSGGQTETAPPTTKGVTAYPSSCTNPDPCTGCGALFYLSSGGGTLSVASNAGTKQGIALLGSDPSASCTSSGTSYSYQGMVFFVDHAAPAQSHTFGGGGNWSVMGTIYMTNTVNTILGSTGQSQYQSLGLQGNGGNGTVSGEIVVDSLALGGSTAITMNLSATTQQIPYIALVH